MLDGWTRSTYDPKAYTRLPDYRLRQLVRYGVWLLSVDCEIHMQDMMRQLGLTVLDLPDPSTISVEERREAIRYWFSR